MPVMQPSDMVNQVRDLPHVAQEFTSQFDRIVRNVLTPLEYLSVHHVVLTGDGDSYHACHAADDFDVLTNAFGIDPAAPRPFLKAGAHESSVGRGQ